MGFGRPDGDTSNGIIHRVALAVRAITGLLECVRMAYAGRFVGGRERRVRQQDESGKCHQCSFHPAGSIGVNSISISEFYTIRFEEFPVIINGSDVRAAFYGAYVHGGLSGGNEMGAGKPDASRDAARAHNAPDGNPDTRH